MLFAEQDKTRRVCPVLLCSWCRERTSVKVTVRKIYHVIEHNNSRICACNDCRNVERRSDEAQHWVASSRSRDVMAAAVAKRGATAVAETVKSLGGGVPWPFPRSAPSSSPPPPPRHSRSSSSHSAYTPFGDVI